MPLHKINEKWKNNQPFITVKEICFTPGCITPPVFDTKKTPLIYDMCYFLHIIHRMIKKRSPNSVQSSII